MQPLSVPSRSLSFATPIEVKKTPYLETVETKSPTESKIKTLPFSPKISMNPVSSATTMCFMFCLMWIRLIKSKEPLENSQILRQVFSRTKN